MQKWSRVSMGTQQLPFASPYVHWWDAHERPPSLPPEVGDSAGTGGLSFITNNNQFATSLPFAVQARFVGPVRDAATFLSQTFPTETKEAIIKPLVDDAINRGFAIGENVDIIALPNHAKRKDVIRMNTKPWTSMVRSVPKETVIVGIIDDGLALGHPRFQRHLADGTRQSRVLAAWQQDGDYNGRSRISGREIYQSEIEAALNNPTLNATEDTSELYRHLFPAPNGETISDTARGLMSQVGHGTHVMDLACGEDPSHTSKAYPERDNVHIIAVSLPARQSVGMAGTFLELYVTYAMQRIVEQADELWAASRHGAGGYPIVINLSYGQQSGAKTGTSLIEREYLLLQERRKRLGAPLQLVMPAGNDNLTRSNARWKLKKKSSSLPIPWRLLPQDQSANFVEIWTDIDPAEITAGVLPLQLKLLRPGEKPEDVGWINPNVPSAENSAYDYVFYRYPPAAGPTKDSDGQDIVRIYSQRVAVPNVTPDGITKMVDAKPEDAPLPPLLYRQRWVIAVRPTLDHQAPYNEAPAGKWTIYVKWVNTALFGKDAEGKPVTSREVYVNVQVDQDPSPASRTNYRSYFDNPRYRTHQPSSRRLDTYAYTENEIGLAWKSTRGDREKNLEPANVYRAVQRKGTQNALANHKAVIATAAYRLSDGRPSDYSATSYPNERIPAVLKDLKLVRTAPSASFPVEMTPTLSGILAAGNHAGGTVRLQGTSFAAPQASRWVVGQYLKTLLANKAPSQEIPAHLEKLAKNAENPRTAHFKEIAVPKVGLGRMPLQVSPKALGRLGKGDGVTD